MSTLSVSPSTLHLDEISSVADRATDRPIIGHHLVPDFPGWAGANSFLMRIIEQNRPRVVFEVGSGANPTLAPDVVGSLGIRYITSDMNADELKLAPSVFEACCIDLENDPIPADLVGRCDLLFSRMVNEHIRDGEKYHRNLYKLLAPNGTAVHCFAALGTMPFVVNRFTPEWASAKLLNFFGPRADTHKKFRAYYSWSRGPTSAMIARFRRLGYEVVRYDGYYGHNYFKTRFTPLDHLEVLKSRVLRSMKVPLLCAYGVITLRKPP